MIIIIAPPRSGSTFTYQLLTSGTKSLYLSNLWNLLYALPLAAGLLSKKRKSKSNFISNRGWVNGLYGESEGMRFWDYWIGQSLEEPIKNIPSSRIKYIQKVFGRLLRKDCPMITAYLGHAFSISELRRIFPGVSFIYLKRDTISNINSLLQISKENEWFSLKPVGWNKMKKSDVLNRVIWQYQSVVNSIENEISDKDTMVVNYEDICNDSHKFLNDVKNFVAKRGIDLQLELDEVPKSLKLSQIISPYSDDILKIIQLLK